MMRISLDFQFASDMNQMEEMLNRLEAAMVQLGASVEFSEDFSIPVSEALQNAILYGNESDPDRVVRVTMEKHDRTIVVEITDEGIGFRPESTPDPRDSEHLMDDHGRGILLMQAMTDRLTFTQLENGFRVTLEKEFV